MTAYALSQRTSYSPSPRSDQPNWVAGPAAADATPQVRSTGLPGRVAGLLRAVGFDQASIGDGWFVVEVYPADRVDARQPAGYAQPGGDPPSLDEGVREVCELFVGLGGDRPLRQEKLGMRIAAPADVAVDQLGQAPEVEKPIDWSMVGGPARFGSRAMNGLCPYTSSPGGLPLGKRMFSIHCCVEMSPAAPVIPPITRLEWLTLFRAL